MKTIAQTTSRSNRILRNTFYIQLIAYILAAFPSAFAEIFDGIIIGQYLGVDSVAAFGIVTPLVTVLALFGTIISAGTRKRYIRFLGQGQKEQAQQVFSLACVLAVGIATVVMVLVLLFATPITRWLGASKNASDLLPQARAYLIGVAIGMPARNLMWVLWVLMPIDNDRNLPIIASLIMTVANILLDIMVAVVLDGNTFGMGFVTSLCYMIATIVLLTHFLKKERVLKFTFRNLPWSESRNIFNLGSYSGISRVSNLLRGTYMNKLMAAIATTAAIAAYSVHRQAGTILSPLVVGMADTVSVMAGLLNAERDRPMIKRLLTTSFKATAMITLGVSCLVFILAKPFAMLFISDDPLVLSQAARAVRCYAVGMPLYGLNAIYFNYIQSTGKRVLASFSGFLLEGGFLIASAGVMAVFIGVNAVWYAFPVTQVIMLAYYILVIHIHNLEPEMRTDTFFDRLLLLPKSFDIDDDDQIDVSITTMDEVMWLSHQVWEFCDRHGCDRKRKYLLSLAVEEMAGNVIQHGFTRDRKHHSLDVRIMKDGDTYILRIRDDCLYFDPVSRLELFSSEDLTHHVGIRMIVNMANEVRHTCFMRLNNLFVKI